MTVMSGRWLNHAINKQNTRHLRRERGGGRRLWVKTTADIHSRASPPPPLCPPPARLQYVYHRLLRWLTHNTSTTKDNAVPPRIPSSCELRVVGQEHVAFLDVRAPVTHLVPVGCSDTREEGWARAGERERRWMGRRHFVDGSTFSSKNRQGNGADNRFAQAKPSGSLACEQVLEFDSLALFSCVCDIYTRSILGI